ncbi:MAG: DUF1573 domain-containing protein [Candidatus Zixiibacteriota bacterium]
MSMRILSSLILFVAVCASQVFGGPKAKFTDDSFDFGMTAQGTILTHAFWIKSVGDQTVRIVEVEPGCGCTKAPLLDSVLAPGDSTRLDITLSTKGFVGRIAKRPYFVTSSNPEKIYLKLFADIVKATDSLQPISITPSRVDVSQFNKLRRKAKFTITNHSNVDQNVMVVDSSHKSFDVTLPPKLKANSSIEGQIMVHENAIEKNFEESITIEFDGEDRTRISVFVGRLYRPTDGTAASTNK